MKHVRLAVTAFALCATLPASAESVEEFYKGRQVSLIVGSGTGGGYDSYARLVARHIGRHIPGIARRHRPEHARSGQPQHDEFRVQRRAEGWLGAGRMPEQRALRAAVSIRFRPAARRRASIALKINWIGSAAKENFIPFVMSETGIKTLDELRTRPVRFGASAPSTDNGILALVLNRVFQTRIEVIHGYPGSTASLIVALEQKEIDGLAGMPLASLRVNASHLLAANRIQFLAQFGMTKHPDLPDVPLVIDLAPSAQDKEVLRAIIARYEMARPVFAAPEVPAERVAALRAAFEAAIADPALLKDAATQKLDIELVRGEDIAAMVASAYKLPPDLVERVKSAINLQ